MHQVKDSKVYVAFYKGGDTLLDKLIKWITFGKYSHVELVMNGFGYSSNSKGGVYRKIHEYDDNLWDYIPLNGMCETIIHKFYHKTKKDGYDYLAALSVLIPISSPIKRWDCVEWVGTALKISGCEKLWKYDPARLSPTKLYEILIKHD